MVTITDIYYQIDSKIMEQGFYEGDIARKKQLIDENLKEYIGSKIAELNSGVLLERTKEISVVEYLAYLASLIPPEEHFNTLRHFVHYILNVAGNLQGFSILWWCEEKPELIEKPIIEFDTEGKWEKLITHEKTDYVQTFAFGYNIFQNQFMMSEPQKRIE